jgi:hypothetical protein
MIRKNIFIFVALIMVGCSHNNQDTACLNMFHPDTNIQITDIIKMGGVRVKGIDIDMYEFKRDDTAEAALSQIDEKEYALPFVADSRKLYKIGVNFNSETRQMDGWLVEER